MVMGGRCQCICPCALPILPSSIILTPPLLFASPWGFCWPLEPFALTKDEITDLVQPTPRLHLSCLLLPSLFFQPCVSVCFFFYIYACVFVVFFDLPTNCGGHWGWRLLSVYIQIILPVVFQGTPSTPKPGAAERSSILLFSLSLSHFHTNTHTSFKLSCSSLPMQVVPWWLICLSSSSLPFTPHPSILEPHRIWSWYWHELHW